MILRKREKYFLISPIKDENEECVDTADIPSINVLISIYKKIKIVIVLLCVILVLLSFYILVWYMVIF